MIFKVNRESKHKTRGTNSSLRCQTLFTLQNLENASVDFKTNYILHFLNSAFSVKINHLDITEKHYNTKKLKN